MPLLVWLALPLDAHALTSARVIWTETTGAGVVGGPTIAAEPGDLLTAELRLTADGGGLNAYGISLEFDRDFEDELDLDSVVQFLPPGFSFHLGDGPYLQESTFSQRGEVYTYNAATLSVGPSNVTFVAGTVTFEVNQARVLGQDVFSGIFNAGDEVCSLSVGCVGLATSFQNASVVPRSDDELRASFVHVATPDNITLWTTEIDHPAANGRPEAVLLVEQDWDPGLRPGTYNDHHVGVFYDSSSERWSIVNLDFAAMTDGAAFNVLVAKQGGRAFVHEADAAATSFDTTRIDHPLANGNPSARILVTPNVNGFGTPSVFDDHPIGVFYDPFELQWGIFNEGGATMPVGADFNVLIVEDAASFVHFTSPANSSGNGTVLADPRLDGDPNALFYLTNNLSPGGALNGSSAHSRGVYYHLGRWRIFNQDGSSMDTDTAFNVFIPSSAGATTVHASSAFSVGGNTSEIADPLTDTRLSPILFTTLRGGTNDHRVGVYVSQTPAIRWKLFNEDFTSFPLGASYSVFAPALDMRTFVHRTSAENTTSNWTTLGHPWTEGNPDALVFVTHTWNPDLQPGVYHDQTVGVFWDGNDWSIFNEDTAASMQAGVSFNVHVADLARTTAFVHTATPGNTSGDTTTIDHASLNGRGWARPIVTQNWNPPGSIGVYNDHEVAMRYDAGTGRWQIYNQDGAGILNASFNVPEPGRGIMTACGAALLALLDRRRRRLTETEVEKREMDMERGAPR